MARSRTGRLLLLLLVVVVALTTTLLVSAQTSNSTTTASQCEVCRDTGNCATAFRGNPGKFCNAWLNKASQRMACCCGTGDVCVPLEYECKCRSASSNRSTRVVSSAYLWGGIGMFLVGALIGGCLYMAMKKRRRNAGGHADQAPYNTAQPALPGQPGYSQPVYVQPGHAGQSGYAQPVYAQGGYAHQGYGHGYGGGYGHGDDGGYGHYGGNRRGMGTGTAVAAGAGAGLLGGLLVGEALGDMGDGGMGMGGGEFGGDF